nr:hypothetical protein [Tanacetum cinerariifolium]
MLSLLNSSRRISSSKLIQGKNSKQKKELLPFVRFTKLIIKDILSRNNHIFKRLNSCQHITKVDATLGNLKFTNMGAKDPVFGMPIPMVMPNDDIKTFANYSEYLAKSKGGKPKGRVKKARKASKDDYFLQQHPKGSSEGSNVTPEFLMGSSSKSKYKERFLTTGEENYVVDVDAEKKTDNAQDGDELAGEY